MSELIRFDPFGNLWARGLAPSLDRILQDVYGDARRAPAPLQPALDVTETKDEYRLAVEVPGVSKNDLTVDMHEGVLTIRGEKRSERAEGVEKARVLERGFGAFTRSLALPADADPEHIGARYADGVLYLTIPKRPEAKPRTIAIHG